MLAARLRALRASSRHAQRGMTLIEIMVVVLIMGLIMGTVGFAVFRYFKKSKVKATKMKVQRVLNMVQEHMADVDVNSGGEKSDCPSIDKLDAVPKSKRTDAWGKKLHISCRGENVCVWSSGPNKRNENGGGDDIKACNEE